MIVTTTMPLFPWDALEDSPSPATVKKLLASIPDERLLHMLRQHRGHGRNDYPVHVLWGVLLLRIILRHVSFEATLGTRMRVGHGVLLRLHEPADGATQDGFHWLRAAGEGTLGKLRLGPIQKALAQRARV